MEDEDSDIRTLGDVRNLFRAMVHGNVSPKDIKALSVPLFSHRLEVAHDADQVLAECVAPVVERITRKTMAA